MSPVFAAERSLVDYNLADYNLADYNVILEAAGGCDSVGMCGSGAVIAPEGNGMQLGDYR